MLEKDMKYLKKALKKAEGAEIAIVLAVLIAQTETGEDRVRLSRAKLGEMTGRSPNTIIKSRRNAVAKKLLAYHEDLTLSTLQ